MANIITTLALEMNANWYVSKKLNSIGRVGENTVTKLTIEPTEILDATYEIEIMSADGSKNVAELTIDGTELYLILTANMLTTSGITKMQVRAVFEDGSIKKSNIFELKVNRSISATDYYEEYSVTIFDQLVAECRDIIEGAESYAVRAETAAVNAEAYSEAASASAEAASTSAANAAASETNASTSATNAHTSETNAASSATSAANSATSANTSATNAANSASSAATSASNAHNSEVNASTSETNASASATEAAASAESIASSVAQINENTYRINDLEAIIGGYQLTDLPTGAVASITDGTALLMSSLKVGIEPVQDLHGYDHPWAGGTGKNLANFVNGKTISTDGIVIDDASRIATVEPIIIENEVNYVFKHFSALNIYGIIAVFNGDTLVRREASIINGAQLDVSGGDRFYFCIYSDITVDTAKAMIVKSTDTATSYSPYSNICPISGWAATNVTVSPTTSAEDGATYNIQFKDGDNPLTVYGGTLNVTTGELVVDRAMVTIDGSSGNISRVNTNQFNIDNLISGYKRAVNYNSGICSTYKSFPQRPGNAIFDTDAAGYNACYDLSSQSETIRIKDTRYDTVSDFTAMLATEKPTIVYELAAPITYHLTPTQVRTLVGNNNIWADTGDIIEGKYYRSPF